MTNDQKQPQRKMLMTGMLLFVVNYALILFAKWSLLGQWSDKKHCVMNILIPLGGLGLLISIIIIVAAIWKRAIQMMGSLNYPPWKLLIAGWLLFLFSHACLALLAGITDRTPTYDRLNPESFLLPWEYLAIPASTTLVIAATWQLTTRIQKRAMKICALVLGIGAQLCLGFFAFFAVGLSCYVLAGGKLWRN